MSLTVDPFETRLVKELTHERPWIGCRLHPEGGLLFAGSEDFQVWRVDLESGAKTAFPCESWVRALCLCDEGSTLITGGYDGRLIWWSALAESPTPARVIAAHEGWIRAIALSPDKQLVATCGNDLLVKLWRVSDGSLVRQYSGHQRHVYHVAIHPNGKHIVAGDLTAKFIHWELESGAALRQFELPVLHLFDQTFLADYGGPYCMMFSEDGAVLACGGITNVTNSFAAVGNPVLSVMDWETGTEKCAHVSKAGIRGKLWGAAIHPTGFHIGVSGGPDGGYLFFWKPEEKEEFHSFNLQNVARDLVLHPDGVRLITVHFDGKIRVSAMAAAS